MELLLNSKTEYLLEASLESLHAESIEWLKEIDFWSDEMAFFYRLLKKSQSDTPFPSTELAATEMELVSITSDKVDKLRNEIFKHERTPSLEMRNTSAAGEEGYRVIHRKLLMDMVTTSNLIRAFKKEVFSFVQKYN